MVPWRVQQEFMHVAEIDAGAAGRPMGSALTAPLVAKVFSSVVQTRL